jgi:hypothetical protein
VSKPGFPPFKNFQVGTVEIIEADGANAYMLKGPAAQDYRDGRALRELRELARSQSPHGDTSPRIVLYWGDGKDFLDWQGVVMPYDGVTVQCGLDAVESGATIAEAADTMAVKLREGLRPR